MAQHRAASAREHRRHPAPLVAEPRVAKRVDALMDAVQPPRLDPPRHPTGPTSNRAKLMNRDHTVLPRRDFRSPRVGRVAFLPHSGTKAPRPLTSPPISWVGGLRRR